MVLERVDDDVIRVGDAPPDERLSDGERGTAVREADLDDDLRVLAREEIAEHVSVIVIQRDPAEVAINPAGRGAVIPQHPTCLSDDL